ncbi:SCP2 sterol-binding domain-containing protein, partial [Kickxella alabastrina]|uniref:SCP2 sterol-binding domain-containing protein n=1 Tax=Kickxella alabastrina TaxID=61397 RepID=UPI00221F4A52
EDRKNEVNKTKAVYAFEVTNTQGKKHYFVIDLKHPGTSATDIVLSGTAADNKKTAGVTLILKDSDFVDLASGKLTGQGAFMSGKLKSKGNVMLALKLESVLKAAKGPAPSSRKSIAYHIPLIPISKPTAIIIIITAQ